MLYYYKMLDIYGREQTTNRNTFIRLYYVSASIDLYGKVVDNEITEDTHTVIRQVDSKLNGLELWTQISWTRGFRICT